MPARRAGNPRRRGRVRLSGGVDAGDAGTSGAAAGRESARLAGFVSRGTGAGGDSSGKDSVSIEHVKTIAVPVLAHRLLVRNEALKDYPDGAAVIREIVAATKIAA